MLSLVSALTAYLALGASQVEASSLWRPRQANAVKRSVDEDRTSYTTTSLVTSTYEFDLTSTVITPCATTSLLQGASGTQCDSSGFESWTTASETAVQAANQLKDDINSFLYSMAYEWDSDTSALTEALNQCSQLSCIAASNASSYFDNIEKLVSTVDDLMNTVSSHTDLRAFVTKSLDLNEDVREIVNAFNSFTSNVQSALTNSQGNYDCSALAQLQSSIGHLSEDTETAARTFIIRKIGTINNLVVNNCVNPGSSSVFSTSCTSTVTSPSTTSTTFTTTYVSWSSLSPTTGVSPSSALAGLTSSAKPSSSAGSVDTQSRSRSTIAARSSQTSAIAPSHEISSTGKVGQVPSFSAKWKSTHPSQVSVDTSSAGSSGGASFDESSAHSAIETSFPHSAAQSVSQTSSANTVLTASKSSHVSYSPRTSLVTSTYEVTRTSTAFTPCVTTSLLQGPSGSQCDVSGFENWAAAVNKAAQAAKQLSDDIDSILYLDAYKWDDDTNELIEGLHQSSQISCISADKASIYFDDIEKLVSAMDGLMETVTDNKLLRVFIAKSLDLNADVRDIVDAFNDFTSIVQSTLTSSQGNYECTELSELQSSIGKLKDDTEDAAESFIIRKVGALNNLEVSNCVNPGSSTVLSTNCPTTVTSVATSTTVFTTTDVSRIPPSNSLSGLASSTSAPSVSSDKESSAPVLKTLKRGSSAQSSQTDASASNLAENTQSGELRQSSSNPNQASKTPSYGATSSSGTVVSAVNSASAKASANSVGTRTTDAGQSLLSGTGSIPKSSSQELSSSFGLTSLVTSTYEVNLTSTIFTPCVTTSLLPGASGSQCDVSGFENWAAAVNKAVQAANQLSDDIDSILYLDAYKWDDDTNELIEGLHQSSQISCISADKASIYFDDIEKLVSAMDGLMETVTDNKLLRVFVGKSLDLNADVRDIVDAFNDFTSNVQSTLTSSQGNYECTELSELQSSIGKLKDDTEDAAESFIIRKVGALNNLEVNNCVNPGSSTVLSTNCPTTVTSAATSTTVFTTTDVSRLSPSQSFNGLVSSTTAFSSSSGKESSDSIMRTSKVGGGSSAKTARNGATVSSFVDNTPSGEPRHSSSSNSNKASETRSNVSASSSALRPSETGLSAENSPSPNESMNSVKKSPTAQTGQSLHSGAGVTSKYSSQQLFSSLGSTSLVTSTYEVNITSTFFTPCVTTSLLAGASGSQCDESGFDNWAAGVRKAAQAASQLSDDINSILYLDAYQWDDDTNELINGLHQSSQISCISSNDADIYFDDIEKLVSAMDDLMTTVADNHLLRVFVAKSLDLNADVRDIVDAFNDFTANVQSTLTSSQGNYECTELTELQSSLGKLSDETEDAAESFIIRKIGTLNNLEVNNCVNPGSSTVLSTSCPTSITTSMTTATTFTTTYLPSSSPAVSGSQLPKMTTGASKSNVRRSEGSLKSGERSNAAKTSTLTSLHSNSKPSKADSTPGVSLLSRQSTPAHSSVDQSEASTASTASPGENSQVSSALSSHNVASKTKASSGASEAAPFTPSNSLARSSFTTTTVATTAYEFNSTMTTLVPCETTLLLPGASGTLCDESSNANWVAAAQEALNAANQLSDDIDSILYLEAYKWDDDTSALIESLHKCSLLSCIKAQDAVAIFENTETIVSALSELMITVANNPLLRVFVAKSLDLNADVRDIVDSFNGFTSSMQTALTNSRGNYNCSSLDHLQSSIEKLREDTEVAAESFIIRKVGTVANIEVDSCVSPGSHTVIATSCQSLVTSPATSTATLTSTYVTWTPIMPRSSSHLSSRIGSSSGSSKEGLSSRNSSKRFDVSSSSAASSLLASAGLSSPSGSGSSPVTRASSEKTSAVFTKPTTSSNVLPSSFLSRSNSGSVSYSEISGVTPSTSKGTVTTASGESKKSSPNLSPTASMFPTSGVRVPSSSPVTRKTEVHGNSGSRSISTIAVPSPSSQAKSITLSKRGPLSRSQVTIGSSRASYTNPSSTLLVLPSSHSSASLGPSSTHNSVLPSQETGLPTREPSFSLMASAASSRGSLPAVSGSKSSGSQSNALPLKSSLATNVPQSTQRLLSSSAALSVTTRPSLPSSALTSKLSSVLEKSPSSRTALSTEPVLRSSKASASSALSDVSSAAERSSMKGTFPTGSVSHSLFFGSSAAVTDSSLSSLSSLDTKSLQKRSFTKSDYGHMGSASTSMASASRPVASSARSLRASSALSALTTNGGTIGSVKLSSSAFATSRPAKLSQVSEKLPTSDFSQISKKRSLAKSTSVNSSVALTSGSGTASSLSKATSLNSKMRLPSTAKPGRTALSKPAHGSSDSFISASTRELSSGRLAVPTASLSASTPLASVSHLQMSSPSTFQKPPSSSGLASTSEVDAQRSLSISRAFFPSSSLHRSSASSGSSSEASSVASSLSASQRIVTSKLRSPVRGSSITSAQHSANSISETSTSVIITAGGSSIRSSPISSGTRQSALPNSQLSVTPASSGGRYANQSFSSTVLSVTSSPASKSPVVPLSSVLRSGSKVHSSTTVVNSALSRSRSVSEGFSRTPTASGPPSRSAGASVLMTNSDYSSSLSKGSSSNVQIESGSSRSKISSSGFVASFSGVSVSGSLPGHTSPVSLSSPGASDRSTLGVTSPKSGSPRSSRAFPGSSSFQKVPSKVSSAGDHSASGTPFASAKNSGSSGLSSAHSVYRGHSISAILSASGGTSSYPEVSRSVSRVDVVSKLSTPSGPPVGTKFPSSSVALSESAGPSYTSLASKGLSSGSAQFATISPSGVSTISLLSVSSSRGSLSSAHSASLSRGSSLSDKLSETQSRHGSAGFSSASAVLSSGSKSATSVLTTAARSEGPSMQSSYTMSRSHPPSNTLHVTSSASKIEASYATKSLIPASRTATNYFGSSSSSKSLWPASHSPSPTSGLTSPSSGISVPQSHSFRDTVTTSGLSSSGGKTSPASLSNLMSVSREASFNSRSSGQPSAGSESFGTTKRYSSGFHSGSILNSETHSGDTAISNARRSTAFTSMLATESYSTSRKSILMSSGSPALFGTGSSTYAESHSESATGNGLGSSTFASATSNALTSSVPSAPFVSSPSLTYSVATGSLKPTHSGSALSREGTSSTVMVPSSLSSTKLISGSTELTSTRLSSTRYYYGNSSSASSSTESSVPSGYSTSLSTPVTGSPSSSDNAGSHKQRSTEATISSKTGTNVLGHSTQHTNVVSASVRSTIRASTGRNSVSSMAHMSSGTMSTGSFGKALSSPSSTRISVATSEFSNQGNEGSTGLISSSEHGRTSVSPESITGTFNYGRSSSLGFNKPSSLPGVSSTGIGRTDSSSSPTAVTKISTNSEKSTIKSTAKRENSNSVASSGSRTSQSSATLESSFSYPTSVNKGHSSITSQQGDKSSGVTGFSTGEASSSETAPVHTGMSSARYTHSACPTCSSSAFDKSSASSAASGKKFESNTGSGTAVSGSTTSMTTSKSGTKTSGPSTTPAGSGNKSNSNPSSANAVGSDNASASSAPSSTGSRYSKDTRVSGSGGGSDLQTASNTRVRSSSSESRSYSAASSGFSAPSRSETFNEPSSIGTKTSSTLAPASRTSASSRRASAKKDHSSTNNPSTTESHVGGSVLSAGFSSTKISALTLSVSGSSSASNTALSSSSSETTGDIASGSASVTLTGTASRFWSTRAESSEVITTSSASHASNTTPVNSGIMSLFSGSERISPTGSAEGSRSTPISLSTEGNSFGSGAVSASITIVASSTKPGAASSSNLSSAESESIRDSTSGFKSTTGLSTVSVNARSSASSNKQDASATSPASSTTSKKQVLSLAVSSTTSKKLEYSSAESERNGASTTGLASNVRSIVASATTARSATDTQKHYTSSVRSAGGAAPTASESTTVTSTNSASEGLSSAGVTTSVISAPFSTILESPSASPTKSTSTYTSTASSEDISTSSGSYGTSSSEATLPRTSGRTTDSGNTAFSTSVSSNGHNESPTSAPSTTHSAYITSSTTSTNRDESSDTFTSGHSSTSSVGGSDTSSRGTVVSSTDSGSTVLNPTSAITASSSTAAASGSTRPNSADVGVTSTSDIESTPASSGPSSTISSSTNSEDTESLSTLSGTSGLGPTSNSGNGNEGSNALSSKPTPTSTTTAATNSGENVNSGTGIDHPSTKATSFIGSDTTSTSKSNSGLVPTDHRSAGASVISDTASVTAATSTTMPSSVVESSSSSGGERSTESNTSTAGSSAGLDNSVPTAMTASNTNLGNGASLTASGSPSSSVTSLTSTGRMESSPRTGSGTVGAVAFSAEGTNGFGSSFNTPVHSATQAENGNSIASANTSPTTGAQTPYASTTGGINSESASTSSKEARGRPSTTVPNESSITEAGTAGGKTDSTSASPTGLENSPTFTGSSPYPSIEEGTGSTSAHSRTTGDSYTTPGTTATELSSSSERSQTASVTIPQASRGPMSGETGQPGYHGPSTSPEGNPESSTENSASSVSFGTPQQKSTKNLLQPTAVTTSNGYESLTSSVPKPTGSDAAGSASSGIAINGARTLRPHASWLATLAALCTVLLL